jgi:hypothetical protein
MEMVTILATLVDVVENVLAYHVIIMNIRNQTHSSVLTIILIILKSLMRRRILHFQEGNILIPTPLHQYMKDPKFTRQNVLLV